MILHSLFVGFSCGCGYLLFQRARVGKAIKQLWSRNKPWPQRMKENFYVTLGDFRAIYFQSKTLPFLTNAGEAWEG